MNPMPIHRQRVKGWKLPPDTVCVTRPHKFGNPFKTADQFKTWLETGSFRMEDLTPSFIKRWCMPEERYVVSILEARRENVLKSLPELKGKNLACFCPLPPVGQNDTCHRAVLMALANKQG